MIVNIRGTGGSGKSYIVRQVMAQYTPKPVYTIGRKRPYGYECLAPDKAPLWVVGHYETACGGGDTFKSPGEVFDSVSQATALGNDVIFEGIISQDDVVRTVDLHRAYPLVVIVLDVPIDICLASIQSRRDAKGTEKPLNPKNTVNRVKSVMSTASRLKDAGITVRKLGREAALAEALDLLGWSANVSA